MSLKKIAAQYELMKLADSFQSLVKKFAQEQQQSNQPEVSNVKAVSSRAMSLMGGAAQKARDAVEARYTQEAIYRPGREKEEKAEAGMVYKLKPEFASQYRTPPAGPTVDPYYTMSLKYSSAGAVATMGGKYYEAPGYESKVTLIVRPIVKDPRVFNQYLDVNALRNEVVKKVSEELQGKGKLAQGSFIPAKIVNISVQPITK